MIPSSKDFSTTLQGLAEKRQSQLNGQKSSILILGGGPAGLMHTIVALTWGHKVSLLEKREEEDKGRFPVATITKMAKNELLEIYGIFQYLEENKKIGPVPEVDSPFAFAVSIRALEEAMKEVIKGIIGDEESPISYESTLEGVDVAEKKFIIKSKSEIKTISAPDYLMIAEGTRSKTLERMGIERIEVLSPYPVIGGIFTNSHEMNRSFISINDEGANLAGLVLTVPGIVYAGRLITDEERRTIAESSNKEERAGYIAERLQLEFFESSEDKIRRPFKPYSSLDEVINVGLTTIRTTIASKFCGKLTGMETHFFIIGDARLEQDTTMGFGCDNALRSANHLIQEINNNDPSNAICEYDRTARAYAESRIRRTICQRSGSKIGYDELQSTTVLNQLIYKSFIAKARFNNSPSVQL